MIGETKPQMNADGTLITADWIDDGISQLISDYLRSICVHLRFGSLLD